MLQTEHYKVNVALSGYRNYTAPPFVFSSDEFKVLKNLKNDNSIFIIKPDKGNGVVIINRDDYWSKMESILSRGVGRSIIGGANIHIFVFTDCKNN